MPQEFQVLQCYGCKTFQVHQVKKALKWACKLCGEKQSVVKVYGRGTGADCRQHVQRLNTMRGELDEVKGQGLAYNGKQKSATFKDETGKWSGFVEEASEDDTWNQAAEDHTSDVCIGQEENGKWSAFVEASEDTSRNQAAEDHTSDQEARYTTDATLFRGRKRKSFGKEPSSRKQARTSQTVERDVGDSHYSRSGQSVFTDSYETPAQKPLNNSYNFSNFENKFDHGASYGHQSRQGTSSNIHTAQDEGTSHTKWGMFVTNASPSEEHSSGEDNSENLQSSYRDYDSREKEQLSNKYCSSNQRDELQCDGKVSVKVSKWDMFMSCDDEESSCQSDVCINKSSARDVDLNTKKNKTSYMPQTSSKLGQFLSASSVSSAHEKSVKLAGKEDKRYSDFIGKKSEKNLKAGSQASGNAILVDSSAVFSLGDLSDDDLEF